MLFGRFRTCAASVGAALTLLVFAGAAPATAQTYGIATMQPGTLNHTTGSAIAKVLKEKADLNVLVQPTAGETTLIPMVGRAEAELGIANIAEVVNVTKGGSAAGQQPDLRLIGSIHALRVAFFVRKDSDLKIDRRPQGQARDRSATRPCAPSTPSSNAMLAHCRLDHQRCQASARAQRYARRRRFLPGQR